MITAWLLAASLAFASEPSPVVISIEMAGTSPCAWVYDGRRFEDASALVAAFPKPHDSKARIRIVGPSATPYRCVGGLVFELQVAHYADIAVVARDDSSAAAAPSRSGEPARAGGRQ